ncbi:MAG: ATP-dependent RecD-like DNA helicase [Oscillospiraceae bacterium]
MTQIDGCVDCIVYRNDENGYVVLMLDAGGELVTAVGELGNVEEGEEVTLSGEYVSHPKYGVQFKAELCERRLPHGTRQIQKYLASGVIKGIGPVLAKKIVAKFGDRALDILEHEPDRLTEVDGITPKKCRKISDEFQTVFGVRALMIFLAGYEIPPIFGVRAWRRWGAPSEEMIAANPYVLCAPEVELPFVKADEAAAKLHIPRDAKMRVRAGISHVLAENADSGHTCLPAEVLKKLSCAWLGIGEELFDAVLAEELEAENLYAYPRGGRTYIISRDFFAAESYIARRLMVMKETLFDNRIDFSEVIDLAEEEKGIHYAEKQREAINSALTGGFLVLTGGPGTGKTTTLNAIISLFAQQGMNVMICAPTGRAAKRISDLTGYEAKTIHRLLEVGFAEASRVKFIHDENNLLDCDVLIIDEMSMVDTLLFEAVLKAVSFSCKLVMVGDSDQLPSVGAGNVLKDIIDSGVVPTVTLTEIFRQAQESSIVTNAHRIVRGEDIDLTRKDADFFFFQRLEYPALQELVVELCQKRLPEAYGFSPLEQIQVLSPSRKGPAGTGELNKLLQNRLNPPARDKAELSVFGTAFRIGDKVMQNRNNYDIEWKKDGENGAGIFNGDIGRITSVNKHAATVTIDFDGRVAIYTTEMLEWVELAYAVTVHKSQGSEFDVVIMTAFSGFDKLYYRNLLYTAVTRAKKMLIIVGSKKRVEFMIRNNRRTLRYTCLREMLCGNAGGIAAVAADTEDADAQQAFEV